jgi:hypothetical protein
VRGLEARLLPLYPMLTLFTTHDEAAAAASLQNIGSMDAESSWTLRALTVSPKQQRSAVPAVDFKLRSDDR